MLLRVLRIDAHQQMKLETCPFQKNREICTVSSNGVMTDKRFQYFEVTNIETKSKIKVIRQMKF